MSAMKTESKNELCQACLSSDRKLCPLGNNTLYFSLLTEDQKLHTTLYATDMAMCWECTATLHRMEAFQVQVQKAHAVLQDLAFSLPVDYTFSNLTVHLKHEYDAIFKENELEESTQTKKYNINGSSIQDQTDNIENEMNFPMNFKNYAEESECLRNDSEYHDIVLDNMDDLSENENIDTEDTVLVKTTALNSARQVAKKGREPIAVKLEEELLRVINKKYAKRHLMRSKKNYNSNKEFDNEYESENDKHRENDDFDEIKYTDDYGDDHDDSEDLRNPEGLFESKIKYIKEKKIKLEYDPEFSPEEINDDNKEKKKRDKRNNILNTNGFITQVAGETEGIENEIYVIINCNKDYAKKSESLRNDSDHHIIGDDNIDSYKVEKSQQKTGKKRKLTSTHDNMKNNERKTITSKKKTEDVVFANPKVVKLEEGLSRIINAKNVERQFVDSKNHHVNKSKKISMKESDDKDETENDDFNDDSDNDNGDVGEDDGDDDSDDFRWDTEGLSKSEDTTYIKKKKQQPESDPEFCPEESNDNTRSKLKKKRAPKETSKKLRKALCCKKLVLTYNHIDVGQYFTEIELSEQELKCTLLKEDAIVHVMRPHKCNECGRCFTYKRTVDKHKKLAHNKQTTRRLEDTALRALWRCNICARMFRKQHTEAHIRDCHRRQFMCNEEGCQWSSKVFWCREDFDRHWESCHRTLTCDICGKRTISKNYMMWHMQEKHLRTMVAHCPICARAFKTRSAVRQHVEHKHAAEPAERRYCVECDAGYGSVAAYKTHLHKVHGPKRRYPCPECGRVLASRTTLGNHVALYHSGRTKYQCHICGKYMSRAQGLQNHINWHNNVKKPKTKPCTICGRMFSTNRILRHHTYTHTGERPFKCEHCTAAFTQPHCLRVHLAKTHGVHQKIRVSHGRLVTDGADMLVP